MRTQTAPTPQMKQWISKLSITIDNLIHLFLDFTHNFQLMYEFLLP